MNGNRSTQALILMDLQNEVTSPEGVVGKMGMAAQAAEKNVVQNTQKVLAKARKAGIPVVHVGLVYRKGHPDINPGPPIFHHLKEANAFVEGSWGAQFDDRVKPVEGEIVVHKRAVSGLSGSDLANLLRVAGVKTLVLVGIATNFVIEGTARQAADEGFQVIVLKDCCSTMNDAMHQASLEFMAFVGTISTSDEFLSSAA